MPAYDLSSLRVSELRQAQWLGLYGMNYERMPGPLFMEISLLRYCWNLLNRLGKGGRGCGVMADGSSPEDGRQPGSVQFESCRRAWYILAPASYFSADTIEAASRARALS